MNRSYISERGGYHMTPTRVGVTVCFAGVKDCPHEGPKVYLGPVRCPYYSEHERCTIARGTGPNLFARHYCAATTCLFTGPSASGVPEEGG